MHLFNAEGIPKYDTHLKTTMYFGQILSAIINCNSGIYIKKATFSCTLSPMAALYILNAQNMLVYTVGLYIYNTP